MQFKTIFYSLIEIRRFWSFYSVKGARTDVLIGMCEVKIFGDKIYLGEMFKNEIKYPGEKVESKIYVGKISKTYVIAYQLCSIRL